ncbi:conserved hypothetical protein [Aspergillus terreus NIH2624]|uniref:chitinase n=1 Tax=Aspergillus terreus (strain NIH 2624 / FGSC A1156) TaxID=341663 RepID=Q0CXN1_ASPTN|nr:uncharacterized protein ATEG_01553 [Aspergillus terreus NIH2624]EAU38310.1 conserved hypothetical protein [Aspergillus terreus NIH2624]
MSLLYLAALLVALISSVTAQTFTNCNPINSTCPADPALGTNHTWVFNSTQDDTIWNITNGEITYDGDDGAQFVIAEKLQSPTMQSNFYIFFGVVETHLKMAKGNGIVSSVVLQSDDLDEIDWEWIGGNVSEVQSNYFGKGDDYYKPAGFHYVANADTEFHNYTTNWTPEKLEWIIDGTVVRTLTYDEAKNGTRFPQTPSNVRLGIWPAGDPSNSIGTIEWADGEVDYDAGPYTMAIQKIRVQDYHSGKEYEYSDHSGSFESIKVVEGNSTAVEELNKAPAKSLAEKWAEVPTGGKIGVYVGAAVVGAMLIAGFIFFCLKQRRKGRLEHALDDSKWTAERTEMNNFQSDWKQSDWSHRGYKQVSS